MISDHDIANLKSDKDALIRCIENYNGGQRGEHTPKGQYNCPKCGSGTHKNKSGALCVKQNGDAWRATCQSCGFGGDIIAWVGALEPGLSFPQRVKRAADFASRSYNFDAPPHTSATRKARPKTKPHKEKFSFQDYPQPSMTDTKHDPGAPEEKKNFAVFIEAARARLSAPNARTKYPEVVAYLENRGISLETASKYGVGYEPAWIHPNVSEGKNVSPTHRLIFPHDNGSYAARCIDALPEAQKKYAKMHAGEKGIFNGEALEKWGARVWVVEGEPDALSLMEAKPGTHAVALGGKQAGELLRRIKEGKVKASLILALDNDEAGQKAQDALEKELLSCGVPVAFLSSELMKWCDRTKEDGTIPKDANEMLVLDPEALRKGMAYAEAELNTVLATRKSEYAMKHQASLLIDSFINNEEEFVPFCPTGFPLLDDALGGGLQPGLYVLGALSSLGKTTFAQQIAENIATLAAAQAFRGEGEIDDMTEGRGRDVLFVSLEMDKRKIEAKSLSRLSYEIECEKNADRYRALQIGQFLYDNKGKNKAPIHAFSTEEGLRLFPRAEKVLSVERKNLLADALRIYKRFGAYLALNDRPENCTADKIRQLAYEHIKQTGNTPVIVVDYLQILRPYRLGAQDKENMDFSVGVLQDLAKELATPVFVLSSINRMSYNKPIELDSFKESGGIEFHADVILGLHYKVLEELKNPDKPGDEDRKKLEAERGKPIHKIVLSVLKNRTGERGQKILLSLRGRYNFFEEHPLADPDHEESIELG